MRVREEVGVDKSSPLLNGLIIPERLPRGRPEPSAIEPWIELVEALMARGVSTPSQMRGLLGVGYKTAERWMATIRERWSAGLADERVNLRRERLYREADSVAEVAWMDAMQAESVQERVASLKVVLEANKRKASLCGLDKMEIKLESNVKQQVNVDVVASVETSFGLAPGALEKIGRDAALLLSAPAAEVVEAELIEETEGQI